MISGYRFAPEFEGKLCADRPATRREALRKVSEEACTLVQGPTFCAANELAGV